MGVAYLGRMYCTGPKPSITPFWQAAQDRFDSQRRVNPDRAAKSVTPQGIVLVVQTAPTTTFFIPQAGPFDKKDPTRFSPRADNAYLARKTWEKVEQVPNVVCCRRHGPRRRPLAVLLRWRRTYVGVATALSARVFPLRPIAETAAQIANSAVYFNRTCHHPFIS